jgi:23S rRNA (adenine2503-C2)-methyltransferase
MPAASAWSLSELKASLLDYQAQKQKRITLEYVLLKWINDRPQDLRALLDFIPPLKTAVNLIPYNPAAAAASLAASGPQAVHNFYQGLQNAHIPVTLRHSRGRNTKAACGQLAGD